MHFIKRIQQEQHIPEEDFVENPDTVPRQDHPAAAWHCPHCGWNAQMVMSECGASMVLSQCGASIRLRWYLCRHCGWRNNNNPLCREFGVARLYLMPVDDGRVTAADDDWQQKLPIQQRGCGSEPDRRDREREERQWLRLMQRIEERQQGDAP